MGVVLGKVTVEQPSYEVEKKTSEYEIRKYPKLRVAEVYRSDWKEESSSAYDFESQAFRVLASYIGVFCEPQNKNSSNQQVKIAMTAPVVSKPIETMETRSSGSSLAFILPREYAEEEPPEPVDPRVHLRVIPPRKLAAVTFRGSVNRETLEAERAERLIEKLKEDGYSVVSSKWELARYNPPFTPPSFRRNEILVQVE